MATKLIIDGISPDGIFAGLVFPAVFRRRQKETRFKQEWRLSKLQYQCLRLGWDGKVDMKGWLVQEIRQFNGPLRQRGNLLMALFMALSGLPGGGPPAGAVVLTTQSFQDTSGGGTARCTVRFISNGLLYNFNLNDPPVSVNGEWFNNEPTTGVGSFFEVRALSAGKSGTWTAAAAADNIWITMDVNRQWYVEAAATMRTTAAVFEVGPDGTETADDSASITCVADATA